MSDLLVVKHRAWQGAAPRTHPVGAITQLIAEGHHLVRRGTEQAADSIRDMSAHCVVP